MKFKVGDEVLVIGYTIGVLREHTARVVSAGRKWVKVDVPRFSGDRFSAESGAQDGKGYAPTYRLALPAEWAAEVAERMALDRLKSVGVTIDRNASITAVQVWSAICHLVEPT